MTSLISRIDHLNKKKEEKLIKDMITKFGENVPLSYRNSQT